MATFKVYDVIFDRRSFRQHFGYILPKYATSAVGTFAVDIGKVARDKGASAPVEAWKVDITVYPISRKRPQRFEDFEANFRDGCSVDLPKHFFWRKWERALDASNSAVIRQFADGAITYDDMILGLLENDFQGE
jgi:hypothetical protein